MEFEEVIRKRYSVRGYKPDPVEEEKLQQVLEACRLAPTAANRQPFQIIVIHTEGRHEDLARIYPPDWFSQAPLVICLCSIASQAWINKEGKNYADVDVAIAMDHLILAATSLGLGTCWVAAIDPPAARAILALPEGVEPIVFTPLGYPAADRRIRPRKELSALVHYERW